MQMIGGRRRFEKFANDTPRNGPFAADRVAPECGQWRNREKSGLKKIDGIFFSLQPCRRRRLLKSAPNLTVFFPRPR